MTESKYRLLVIVLMIVTIVVTIAVARTKDAVGTAIPTASTFLEKD